MKKKRKLKAKVKRRITISLINIGILAILLGFLITFNFFMPERLNRLNFKIKTPEVRVNKVRFISVGDALIHAAVYDAARTNSGYDFKPMFSKVKGIINKYDLAFYNQETILGGKEMGLSHYPRFNSPYEVGDAFLDMGFNLVSLANNHTLDRGTKAIKNSKAYWNKKEDVIATGSATSQKQRDKVVIKEKNGITYALLAYTTTTNGLSTFGDDYLVNVYDKDIVKKDVEKLRDKVDLLIVSMHWGSEYTHTPTDEEKEIAKYLAKLNVDIVVGTHPHVIQPIEYIDDTLIIYSLGNFISAQEYTYQLTGAMVSVDIEETEIEGSKSKIKLSNTTAELIYTCKKGNCSQYTVYPYSKLDNSILSNYKNLYKDYKSILTKYDDTIKVVGLK